MSEPWTKTRLELVRGACRVKLATIDPHPGCAWANLHDAVLAIDKIQEEAAEYRATLWQIAYGTADRQSYECAKEVLEMYGERKVGRQPQSPEFTEDKCKTN